jgi:hypothetical protein
MGKWRRNSTDFQYLLDKKIDGPDGRLGRRGQERTVVGGCHEAYGLLTQDSSLRTTRKKIIHFKRKTSALRGIEPWSFSPYGHI